MPTYVILGNFTDQGIRNVRNIRELRQSAEQWVASQGGSVICNLMTFGQYDFVFVATLPGDESALEGGINFGSRGDTRTITMRAFTPDEFERVAERVP